MWFGTFQRKRGVSLLPEDKDFPRTKVMERALSQRAYSGFLMTTTFRLWKRQFVTQVLLPKPKDEQEGRSFFITGTGRPGDVCLVSQGRTTAAATYPWVVYTSSGPSFICYFTPILLRLPSAPFRNNKVKDILKCSTHLLKVFSSVFHNGLAGLRMSTCSTEHRDVQLLCKVVIPIYVVTYHVWRVRPSSPPMPWNFF